MHGLRATLLKQAPAAALELDAVVLALFSSAWSQRVEFPHGVASGDVSPSSAVIWTRASGDATLTNEVSGTPGFEAIQFSGVSAVTAESDYTAKVLLSGLVPDRKYYTAGPRATRRVLSEHSARRRYPGKASTSVSYFPATPTAPV